MCTTPHLSNINLLQLHLGQLCMCGMLVAGASETGAGLRLEEIQEGCIAVRPPIQAAEICGTCTTASSSLFYLPEAAWQGYGQMAGGKDLLCSDVRLISSRPPAMSGGGGGKERGW